MKKAAFRYAIAAAIICCIFSVVFMAGCAEKDDAANGAAQGADGQNVINSEMSLLPDGSGVKQEHIVLAGFDMGVDTPDTFTKKFGIPASIESKEYTEVTIKTAKYDFGVAEYEGPTGGVQVLTYVGVTGELAGPCIVMPGDDLYLTADAIYTGSAQILRTMGEADAEVYLYGDAQTVPRGRYYLLESEYVTSEMAEESALEYIVPVTGGQVQYIIYFDTNKKVTRYDIYFKANQ